MPFDGSGTASIVNSFTPSTTISSTQMNANFTDIASMLTNTLPRDGQAAMTGQMKATDGTVNAPGITFGSDPDNGGYRTGTNAWSLAVGGAQAIAFATTGLTFPKTVIWAKGADVASASPLVLGADGNYFDVTGTAAITSVTVAAGTWFGLQFDGALTLTHHATNLVLPGAANITTAAGDRAFFVAEAANQVRCIAYTKASGVPVKVDGTIVRMGSDAQGDVLYFNGTNYARLGAGTAGQALVTGGAAANPAWATRNVVQVVTAALTSATTATPGAATPADFGLSASITPKTTTSHILMVAMVSGLTSGGARWFPYFTDGSNNKIGSIGDAASNRIRAAANVESSMGPVMLLGDWAPASTSAQTVKVRYQLDSGVTFNINRSASDTDSTAFARAASVLFLVEYEP